MKTCWTCGATLRKDYTKPINWTDIGASVYEAFVNLIPFRVDEGEHENTVDVSWPGNTYEQLGEIIRRVMEEGR